MEGLDEFVLVVVVPFEDGFVGFTDKFPDGVVETCNSESDHQYDVVTTSDEKRSGYEDNSIFIEVENQVN